MIYKIYFFVVFLVCFFIPAKIITAQTLDSINYLQYKFIDFKKNKIENDSSLNLFYQKLSNLSSSKKGRVTITHVGDSHIQADFFSGTIRQKLQVKFGNAGRGLIFPYRVAKSNEPNSYKTYSNSVWESKRNVFVEKPLPIGVSGFTIENSDSTAELILTVKNQPPLDYGFTKFILFHERGIADFDITVCDTLNCELGVLKSIDNSGYSFVSELRTLSPMHQIILRNKSTDTSQIQRTRIYGMLLENDSSGVLYNTIGVNGAEYRHYSLSEHFVEQLEYLNSDLIIVSMGTNEAFNKAFDETVFYKQIDTLIRSIKLTNPNACILLTTPSDSFRKSRKGKIKNPNAQLAEQTIIRYCLKNNLPYWDLYKIMGGLGSMAKWNKAKLSAKDLVHFNTKGYKIQGDLFFNALTK